MRRLPNECLFIVFNNFQFESKILYSCLLVNRHWCRIIIPILWGNLGEKLEDSRLINICLLTLNAEEQALLIPFKIFLPNYPRPLFEYTSYTLSVCRYLNSGVINWLNYKGYKEVNNRWECNRDNLVNAIKCSLTAMFLRTNKKLKYLEVFGFNYNNSILFKNFCGNNNISSLYLYQNQLDFEEITEVLCKNPILTSLNLSRNKIGIKGIKALGNTLYANKTLASLNLVHENIGTEGGKALAKALCENTVLTSLNLSNNYIGIEGGKAFADALYINTTLTFLDLSRNYIGIEGGKALAKALCKNSTLTSLNLSDNNIGIEGGRAFADALYTNTTLTSLNLIYDNIGIEGGKALAEALCKNTTLTSLDLSYNGISFEDEKLLADTLHKRFF